MADRTKWLFSFILILLINSGLKAQNEVKKLNLDEVVRIALSQSRDALAAKHRFRSSFWEFKSYRATYMPMLTLDAVVPNLQRSINKYTQPDGSETFLQQAYTSYSIDMSLSKTIGYTGGQIFMRSGLQRMDNFGDSTVTSYLTTPITIGYNQPIFSYNRYKWLNMIEPLRYDEAKRKYLEDREQIAITATNLFFNLLIEQINEKIALTNQANYDTLYKIAQGRYNLGKIAENELLQLELSLLRAHANVESVKLDLEMNIFKLKSFLGLQNDQKIELIQPTESIDLVVDVQQALAEAYKNRSDALSFERRIIEAESEVNRAKMENRFNANIYAQFGLNQSADFLVDAYNNPLDDQQLILGLEIPILDWGLAKGRIKMAESNRELVKTNVEQQIIDFEQEVFLKVMQFNMQAKQLLIAGKSDTVAHKRYDVTKQRYLIGKINITDLNIAQTEMDNAKQSFISTLRAYWRSYYELRKLSLYDFPNNKILIFDIEEIM
ncbi:MAG: TolC family protein [Bacteroidales bacterium]|nr:TolC family protein [Bacteroidales bacterium]